MRYVVSAIAALLFVSGCASTGSSPQAPGGTPTERLTVRAPGSFDEVTLQGDRMFSPEIEVQRYGDAYRGKAFRKIVDLRVKDGLIDGVVGSGRTELHVVKLPDGFEVKGLYAGRMGNLTVRSDRLEGRLGGRAFQLAGSTTEPQASAPSTGSTEPTAPMQGTSAGGPPGKSGGTEFAIPQSLRALPVEHQAAVIAIFVGR